MSKEFEKRYRIPVYDTDFRGRLFLHSLFNYVQDIAAAHAEILKFGREDLQKNNRFWILARMYASINAMPSWGEEITLRTRPLGVDGLFALRDVGLSDSNGSVIAAVTTSWVVVDITSRRPVRPDTLPDLASREFSGNQPLIRNAEKIGPPADGCPVTELFIVKPSDLDVNLHVNNVKYIQWMYDTIPVSYLSEHVPVSAEINYLSEAVEGDSVRVKYEIPGSGNNRIHCSVIRESDSRELCRIMTEWIPVAN